MTREYACLREQNFRLGNYSLVPIRDEDKYLIMKWRNEQIYHLRQQVQLTYQDQEKYFSDVISKLFDLNQPSQVLFSYLKDGECIGYGGLVHINWTDRNAEISFIMDTALESKEFEKNWLIYLTLLKRIAYQHLRLHKIYTYAFDLRPRLYDTLNKAGFIQEARLKEHCLFEEKYIDVVIHSALNDQV